MDTDEGATRPQCDAPITGEEDACAECGLTFLDEEGGVSDDAVQAMLDNAGVSRPGERGPARIAAPATVRLFVGLTIAFPLGPVVALLAAAVVPLPLWAGVVVLTVGWLVPGYLLARPAVPTLVVANGLLVIGGVMAVAPVAVRGGRALLGTTPADIGTLGTNVYEALPVFLVFGLVVLVAGAAVRYYAVRTRNRWEREMREREA